VGSSWGSANRWRVSSEGRHYGGKPDPQPADLAARQVAIELAGDVALQDADGLSLGLYLLDPALEVELSLGVMPIGTMTMRQGALLVWRSPPS
jgi:hypothetical protein